MRHQMSDWYDNQKIREIKIPKGDVGKTDIFDREKGEYDRSASNA